MLPDDCYRIPMLVRWFNRHMTQADQNQWNRILLRLINACRLLDVDITNMVDQDELDVAIQMAQDRVNKKWAPTQV